MEKFQELSPTTKAIIGTVIGLLAIVLVLTIASNVALLFARQHDGELHIFTVFSLLSGEDARGAKAARLGLLLGGLGVGALLFKLILSNPRALYGRARFASEAEIRRAGLRDKRGLLVGKLRGRFLMFGGSEHLMVYAPTRSGKGVGVVIPNLLNWPDSCIVCDIKKENWTLTAGFRAAHGQSVYLFDPLDPDGRTARYNPLGYLRRDHEVDLYDDLQRIAVMLYPTESKDPFWANAARTAFVGIAGYIAETPTLPLTLGEVLRQIARPDCQAHFWQEIEQRAASRPLSSSGKTALYDFIGTSENTFQSIRKTVSSRLELWLNPRIDAATSASDFDLRELRRTPISIYLGVTPDNLERLAPLLSLFFQQAVDLNIRTLPEHNPGLKRQILLMMDEFAALGPLPVIVRGIAYVAGYGLRIVTILQSPSQLRALYGPDLAKNFMTNHAVEVVFTPKELEDANSISERFGYDTVKGKSLSRGVGFSKSSKNETTSDQRRALMLPQELTLTPNTFAYILKGGIRPIKANKLFYYRDDAFKARLMPPPVVPTIGERDIADIAASPEPMATEIADLKAPLQSALAPRALRLEEIIQPVQPANGADGKMWRMPVALSFANLADVPDAEAEEAAEVIVDGWFDRLIQGAEARARPS